MGKWVLVTVMVAAALLLVAELVDQDWLGAGAWTLVIAISSVSLSRRQSTS
jgi:hypothetical protein